MQHWLAYSPPLLPSFSHKNLFSPPDALSFLGLMESSMKTSCEGKTSWTCLLIHHQRHPLSVMDQRALCITEDHPVPKKRQRYKGPCTFCDLPEDIRKR